MAYESLTDGTEIIVTWDGGNGPWRYVFRLVNGVPCAYLKADPRILVGPLSMAKSVEVADGL